MVQQTLFERHQSALTLADGPFYHNIPAIFDVPRLLHKIGINHPLIVSGGGLARSGIMEEMERRGMPYTQFDGFTPNPTSEQVKQGELLYIKEECDGILSIGGGSAIDVAKGIKAISGNRSLTDMKERLMNPVPEKIIHVAMPTTAGTGSEATRFATIYIDGVKYSCRHDELLPDIAILDAVQLESLPEYQRASTMLDALVQGVESYWALKANAESRSYASQAIQLVSTYAKEYLTHPENIEAANAILVAAYLSGCAINKTTTTAAHAMCYKLTSTFGLAHGHAAALCLEACWQKLLDDVSYAKIMKEIAEFICADNGAEAVDGLVKYQELLALADLSTSWVPTYDDIVPELAQSVNIDRLGNFPISLSVSDIEVMYQSILAKSRA